MGVHTRQDYLHYFPIRKLADLFDAKSSTGRKNRLARIRLAVSVNPPKTSAATANNGDHGKSGTRVGPVTAALRQNQRAGGQPRY